MAKKRNFSRQGGPVWYRGWKDWNEGEYAEGTIVGFSIDKKYKRKNYHLKVEDFNFDLDNHLEEPLEVGKVLVLNGCGILEKHLANAKKGDAVKVEYEGQAEITSGEWEGTQAHSIAVFLEENIDEDFDEEDDDGL